ncbi:hypothetical protein DM01DRAFT_1332152 [Hesseltinella vesiculosa]|uniref:Copper transport protein n=1 Tax=Hesseltinella vesiculosa TaxID=101127 RepID=A0A1X2GU64_9FUNG|nr:hypothetical protein DM01DRAFT_1332152 [Hesseltinella vesiculosa]
MNMGDSSMSMSMGMGTFHWSSTGDGIWLSSWVPTDEAAYIGACIGLFVFAIVSRGLLAVEVYFITWRANKYALKNDRVRPSIILASKQDPSYSSSSSSEALTYPTERQTPSIPPFSWIDDPARSFLTALSSFMSYLLMMVVMTGNGGYFIVVIVGIFVGEMAFGRYRSIGGLSAQGGHDH